MIRVLLADDQVLVRAGFRALLDSQEDIEVVGEAADGEEAVRLATSLTPDIVLMDIRMPGLDGLAATRRIGENSRLSGVRVVILTTFDVDEYVFEAIRAGASGFLVKDTEPAELIQAVRVVAGGDALLSPGITRRLIAEFATRAQEPRPTPELDVLTQREREVMALVAGGLSNDEIAERLVVSPATAKTHVSRAMVKLGARDRAQLVVFAYESGLVRASRVPTAETDAGAEPLSPTLMKPARGGGLFHRSGRVVATVLFTDIVGSTERARKLGDRRWRELLDRHDEVARKVVEQFGGRLVKNTGDGILVTFDSPGSAVRCAAALREELEQIQIHIRAGLHTGEVELRGDDVGGIAVHIGARVMGEAGTGEILVSRTVRDLLTGSDIAFEDRAIRELHGVGDQWQLFAVAGA